MHKIKRLDIFKDLTTYQNDYKSYYPGFQRTTFDLSKNNLDDPPKIPPKLENKDNETDFYRKKNCNYIPFNLFWGPYKPPSDEEIKKELEKKLEARKTRQRLYIAPAIGLDDVDNPETRLTLCNYMYSTEWSKSEREAAQFKKSPKTKDSQINTIIHKIEFIPTIPEQVRKLGKNWEDKQNRAQIDPTRDFWIDSDRPINYETFSKELDKMVPDETKKEIRSLIVKDQLRMPHDIPLPNYGWYKSRYTANMSLRKADIPVTHPFMTVSQAITKRFEENTSET